MSPQQLAILNTGLAQAKTERAGAAARLAQLRELLESGDHIDAVPPSLMSDRLAEMQEQEVRIDGEISQMASRYGSKHPEMKELQAERNELRGAIRDEIAAMEQSLESQLGISETEIDNMTGGFRGDEQAPKTVRP